MRLSAFSHSLITSRLDVLFLVSSFIFRQNQITNNLITLHLSLSRIHSWQNKKQKQSSSRPIGPFNDSNTSEFDDGDAWDSRQDTSLDFHQVNVNAGFGTPLQLKAGCEYEGGTTATTEMEQQANGDDQPGSASNDSVMDADLRETNRFNLEMMMLQNAAQNMMGSMVPLAAAQQVVAGSSGVVAAVQQQAASNLRSKSLTGSTGTPAAAAAASGVGPIALAATGSGANPASTAFPQSGVLMAASELSKQSRANCVPSAEQLVALHRQMSGGSGGARRQSQLSDHDSGIGAGGIATDSRKSSMVASMMSFNQGPTIWVQVRRLSDPQVVDGAPPAGQDVMQRSGQAIERQGTNDSSSGRRSILDTLASIGRSASRQSSDQNFKQQRQQKFDPKFEISIVQARNLTRKSVNTNQQVGSESPQAGKRGFGTGRRESIFGAIMAATGSGGGGGVGNLTGGQASGSSPGAARRSSLDGIFIRVFKNQAGESADSTTHPASRSTLNRSGSTGGSGGHTQQAEDTISVNSYASLASTGQQNCDCLQLPIIKLTASGNQEANATDDSIIKLSELAPTPNAYKFTCWLHEFPLRISLYQVSKRGGARYTIGHCFIAAEDWLLAASSSSPQIPPAVDAKLKQNSRLLSVDSGNEEPQPPAAGSRGKRWPSESSGGMEVAAATDQRPFTSRYRLISTSSATNSTSSETDLERSEEEEFLLEYKLHQTILEATKC